MLKISVFPLLFLLIYSPHVLSSLPGLQLNICNSNFENNVHDCGEVLVGAARVDFNALQWQGPISSGSLLLQIIGKGFGFTGNSVYLREPNPNNNWLFVSLTNISKNTPSPGITFNHFFAPFQPGSFSASENHSFVGGDSYPITVQGTGIADDEQLPAITLNIDTQLNNSLTCVDNNPCDLYVPDRGKTVFTVSPQVHLERLPPGQNVNYVMVNLEVEEIGVRCIQDGITFRDTGQGNKFDPTDYYHHLESTGPNNQPTGNSACKRNYPFLISADKSFWFQAENVRTTGSGYVQYHFSVNGHADATNLNRWPGSQKLFRLSTSPSQTLPPVASFTATPTSGIAPFTVILDATASTNAQKFQWTSTGGQTIGEWAQTAVEFPDGIQPGDYNITLTVTNSAGQSHSTSTIIKVLPPPVDSPPVARFTATPTSGTAPLTVQLDATHSSDAEYYQWLDEEGQLFAEGPNPQAQRDFPTGTPPGNYAITLVVSNAQEQTDRITQVITLSSSALLDFTITPASPVLTGSKVELSADPNIPIYNPEWLIRGDGEYELQGKNSSLAVITFREAGEYNITLVASSDEQGNDNHTSPAKTIFVQDSLPAQAQFTLTPNTGFAPLTVYLDASNSVPSTQANLTDYIWSSKKAQSSIAERSSNGVYTSMTFKEAGTYDITLQIQDSLNQISSVTQTITVLPPDLEFPSLNDSNGNAQIVDLQGILKSFPDASFEGGVLLGEEVGNVATFNSTETVNIVARLRPHNNDLNNPLELLMIVRYQPPGDEIGNWYMRNQSTVFPYQVWDGGVTVENPTRFDYLETAPEAEFCNLTLFSGQFLHAEGHYTLYLGYRRPTGEIIFNFSPLEFTVQP